MFSTIRFCTLVLFATLISVPVLEAMAVTSDENMERLSNEDYWLKLLHYKADGSGQYQSTVITSTFFNSDDGARSPTKELKATLRAIMDPVEENPNLHVICRFPERYYWLSQQIPELSEKAPDPVCSAFDQWVKNKSVDNVSIILATGYLSNPASFYGHLLMKFGSNDADVRNHDLLDKSINYGAIVPEGDNVIVYILKGLFGGYSAGYTPGPFYEHTHNYSDIELRDVWEYELSLSRDESWQLLRHSWELLNNQFVYYYLHENCGYRIAELLSLVLEEPLEDDTQKWTIPASLIQKLAKYQHNNAPLVANTTRHASRQNRFYEKYDQLNRSQVGALRRLTEVPVNYSDAEYQQLADNHKIGVVDTLLEYYELRVNEDESQLIADAKRLTLLEMFSLSATNKLPTWRDSNPPNPENGNPPGMIRIGTTFHQSQYDGTMLNWRIAYFDMLNLDAGTMPYSKLSMIDLNVELQDGELKLKHLDLLDIDTLSLPNTGLKGDKRNSWSLNIGIGSSDNQCSNCTVGYVRGEWGKAVEVVKGTAVYVRALGQMQTETKSTAPAQIGAHMGLVSTISDWWKLKIDYDQVLGFEGADSSFQRTKVEHRFGSSPQWDMRLKYENNPAEKYSISFGYYF